MEKAKFPYPDILLAFIDAGFECKDNFDGNSFTVFAGHPSNIAYTVTREEMIKIVDIIRPNSDVGCDIWFESACGLNKTFQVYNIKVYVIKKNIQMISARSF